LTNIKIERLGRALTDDLILRLASAANPFPVVSAHDASGDLYLTVTSAPGSSALVKFEVQSAQASGALDSLGLAQSVYTPHITKLGIDAGAPGTAASDTATLLADLTSGDLLTVNSHNFTAVDTGAAGDQWNLVGTQATGVLTIGGGADTAFGAGSTVTINGTVLTEGVDFAAGANDDTSATAIAAAITANGTLNTQVTAVATLGGVGVDSTVTVTAIKKGTAGNVYGTTTNDGVATWGAATLLGGALDLTASAVNLAAAIAASATAGIVGVVTATSALAVVTIRAVSVGVSGNAIPVTETGGGMTVATATLSGGTNATAAGTSTTLRDILVAECSPTGTALLIYEKAGIVESDLVNGALLKTVLRNIPWGILAQV
jgi:hypothetical protein